MISFQYPWTRYIIKTSSKLSVAIKMLSRRLAHKSKLCFRRQEKRDIQLSLRGASARVLVCGDVDFSFTKSLVMNDRNLSVTATTILGITDFSDSCLKLKGKANIHEIYSNEKYLGNTVKFEFGVNPTDLEINEQFDLIIWNFPYLHPKFDRQGNRGGNERELLKAFFQCSKERLSANGRILVTLNKVDSGIGCNDLNLYNQSWKLVEQVAEASLLVTASRAFNRYPYRDYIPVDIRGNPRKKTLLSDAVVFTITQPSICYNDPLHRVNHDQSDQRDSSHDCTRESSATTAATATTTTTTTAATTTTAITAAAITAAANIHSSTHTSISERIKSSIEPCMYAQEVVLSVDNTNIKSDFIVTQYSSSWDLLTIENHVRRFIHDIGHSHGFGSLLWTIDVIDVYLFKADGSSKQKSTQCHTSSTDGSTNVSTDGSVCTNVSTDVRTNPLIGNSSLEYLNNNGNMTAVSTNVNSISSLLTSVLTSVPLEKSSPSGPKFKLTIQITFCSFVDPMTKQHVRKAMKHIHEELPTRMGFG